MNFASRTLQKALFHTHYKALKELTTGEPKAQHVVTTAGKIPSHYSEDDLFSYFNELEAHNISPTKYAAYLQGLRDHEQAGTFCRVPL